MTLYQNTDESARYWPDQQNLDGTTVALGPGQEVDLPQVIVDPYLKPSVGARGKRVKQPTDTAAEDVSTGDTSSETSTTEGGTQNSVSQ